MQWEKQIKEWLKDIDKIVPILFFLVMILGPIIKGILQKKKQEQLRRARGGAPATEEKAPDWWQQIEEEEEEDQPEFPPIPQREPETPRASVLTRSPDPDPEPELGPVAAAAMREAETPIERASDDIVAEADRIGAGADAVSAFSLESQLAPDPVERLQVAAAIAPVAVKATSALNRFTPLEAAILFGSAFDRPLAWQEPGQGGPPGLA